MKRKKINLKISNKPKKERKKIPAIPLTPEMAYRIEDQLQESKNEYKAKRDVILLNIALTTGYRMQDLVDLRVGDLRGFLKSGYFKIAEKKKINALKAKLEGYEYVAEDDDGDEVVITIEEIAEKKVKPREVEIIPELKPLLEDYLKGEKNRNFAFRTTKCSKKVKETGNAPYIPRESYSKIILGAAKKIATRTNEMDISEVEGITGHSLRKGYAMNIYETTGDINKVKEMLGHSTVEITKLYLWPIRTMKHEASSGLNKFIRKR
ncbi:tyrosine recombinase XerC [Clostridium puniceum]|uniref:Tyrosine recombinase XerC n=1 Tax=Clostridium puniceum TaxID=29367 RepID=A0A1S8T850_9CLOT|nr:site-specific integrase [Clostridium puniceum]OOM73977.1 tyrosine recombinase XerC [Clostridium puniceum]